MSAAQRLGLKSLSVESNLRAKVKIVSKSTIPSSNSTSVYFKRLSSVLNTCPFALAPSLYLIFFFLLYLKPNLFASFQANSASQLFFL
jgi:hypothetical protein